MNYNYFNELYSNNQFSRIRTPRCFLKVIMQCDVTRCLMCISDKIAYLDKQNSVKEVIL